jgi:hypothetical protein
MLADEESQNRVRRIQHMGLFEVPDPAFGIAFGKQVRPGVEQSGEQVEVVPAERANHLTQALFEDGAFLCFLVLLGDSVSPELFEVGALDEASFGEIFDQRFDHCAVVQAAGHLPVNEIEDNLESFVGALERGFQSADSLEQVFFDGWPKEAFGAVGDRPP